MQPLRTAARAGRHFRPHLHRQSRRHASDSHGHGSHDAHHAPANESIGPSFYLAVAAVPLSMALYTISRPGTDGQPYFTRLITDTYAVYKTKWAERNDLHTQAVERAAADRVLFLNEANRNVRHVDLRFPEQFNVGSPWNVPAGHRVNLDQVIAKYEKELYDANEKKLQQVRENKVPVEQPYEPFNKVKPAATDS